MLIDTTNVRGWRFWPAVWLGFLLAVTIAVLSLAAHQTKHDCGVRQAHQRADNACAPVSADERTADATDWIAAFTIILTVVGGVQGLLIWRQIDLGREEFVSSHRPMIKVRSVDNQGRSETGEWTADITIVNVGQTPAHIMNVAADIGVRDAKTREWSRDAGITLPDDGCDTVKIVLTSGEPKVLTARSASTVQFTKLAFLGSMEDPQKLCVVGVVRYRDSGAGVRRTGFIWQLDPKTQQFEPLDDRKYTYKE